MKKDVVDFIIALGIVVVLLGLTVCSTSPRAQVASDAGVNVWRAAQNDAADAAEAWLCRGISIREWILRYGQSAESRDAWWLMCGGKQEVELPGPNVP